MRGVRAFGRFDARTLTGAQADEVVGVVKDRFPTFQRESGETNGQVKFTLVPKEVERIREFAVEQSLETVRNRIDQLGLSEPIIQRPCSPVSSSSAAAAASPSRERTAAAARA